MHRRRFVSLGAGLVSSLGLAGCTGGPDGSDAGTTTGTRTTPAETTTDVQTDGPKGVYVQPFLEGMVTPGTARQGNYEFALMYTVPHTFWNVTGTDVSRTPKENDDSIHLMATVWDPETATVLPETGLSVEIAQDGESISEEVIYPMLSQRMGFHYGANFTLPRDGTYTATVSVGGMSVRRTGAFAGSFGDAATAEIGFEFTPETREQVSTRQSPQAGQPGALRPMDMDMLPQAIAPERGTLPGTVLGTARSGDAEFVVAHLSGEAADRFTDDGSYLAVSARTRYNGLLLPAMALSGTLTRGGETVYDGPFERTLDPQLDYHYGAAVDGVESGDALTLSVDTPPQVARHEGYETAFLNMPDVELSL